ncbi:MAG TPA: DUF1667 domain-containing protein [Feifaniaceae bacterium]|nr:DUF1667 domain-containing protein [Feifaniaceae bacterium]
MSVERTFTCIVCPNGCTIEVEYEAGRILRIRGNQCKRGKEYVYQEITDPKRTIATTVPISGAALPLCSVRLNRAIPKKEIFNVMKEIGKVRLTAPVSIGQVVIPNVCGLSSDVIVTKYLDAVDAD